MVMDVRRHASINLMQFDQAGTILVPVRWYRAPPGAVPLSVGNAFCSSDFQEHKLPDLGIGIPWFDVPVYDKGATPSGITGKGPPCGPLDWWTNGVPTGTPPLVVDARGISLCCGVPFTDVVSASFKLRVNPFSCQSWNAATTPTRTLTQLSTGQVWVSTLNTTVQQRWHGVTFPGDIMTATRTLSPCGAFNSVLMSLRNNSRLPVGNILIDLVSYNPTTQTGLWRVRVGSLYYSGEYFKFHNPV